jgi:ferrous iron transport protein B
MIYLSQGSLADMQGLGQLQNLLLANGWTKLTALCTMIFSLFHFPCSTTFLTIIKETKSAKWSGLSLLIPTAFGIACCIVIATIARLFNLA